MKIEDKGNDLSILTLDSAVDPENHRITRVAHPRFKTPTTIDRHGGREPIGTYVSGIRDGYIFGWAKQDWIISGDSGGPWRQNHDGEVVVIGTTFRAKQGGRASYAAQILNIPKSPAIVPGK